MRAFKTVIVLPEEQKVYSVESSATNTDSVIGAVPDTLGLGSADPLTGEKRPPEELLFSTPPSRGRRWLTDTCSIKDVPYFLKYHHSKIWPEQERAYRCVRH